MKKHIFYPCDFDDNEEMIPYWEMHRIFNRHVLMDADSLPVYYQLRIKRHYCFLSQAELASHLGMGTSTLCEIESGKRDIPRKYGKAIERFLYRELWYGGALTNEFDDLDDEEAV